MNTIMHIARRADWDEAQQHGSYRAASLAEEGFIHCSTPLQFMDVANRFYRGQHDLVLLWIDTAKLDAALVYEVPAGAPPNAERFPHLYGPLPVAAVFRTEPFEPDADGWFRM